MPYVIVGHLIAADSKQPLAGHRVEAWHQLDTTRSDLLGSAVSDVKGNFSLQFDEALVRQTSGEERLNLFFHVYDSARLVYTTEAAIHQNSPPGRYSFVLEIDPQAAPAEGFLVAVTVRNAAEQPLQGLLVRAFDRDLRHEQALGEAATDAQGRCEIPYGPEQFRRAEKDRADLLVRVFDLNGAELAASDIVFNAPPQHAIELTVAAAGYQAPSEYERYLGELLPLVSLEKISLHQLTDEDLRFLAGETGISWEHLRFIRFDAQWLHEHKLLAAASYGLLRAGLSANLGRLLSEGPERWRAALKSAIEQRWVPSALANQVESIIESLSELAVTIAFRPPEPDSGAIPIGAALATSTLLPDIQRRLVSAIQQHRGDGDVWKALAETGGFDAKSLATARFSLEANAILGGHLPVLRAVQKISETRGWQATRDLAQLAPADWEQIAADVGPVPGFTDTKHHAEALADRVEEAFPTAVIGHRLGNDADLGHPDALRFLDAHPDFDLLATSVDRFLDDGAVLDNLVDPDGLRTRLKSWQRTALITPANKRAETMSALIRRGYSSAYAVLSAGVPAFKSTMQPIIGEVAAAQVLARADARLDHLSLVGLRIRDRLVDPVRVLPGPLATPEVEIPNLTRLFGSLNACRCEHCSSMYGPAAYLVDLLEFLKDTPRPGSADGPLEVLFRRRPDIRELKLNCANANTPLPYIDLVNEILEVAVAGALPAAGASADERERFWSQYQTPNPEGGPRAALEAALRASPRSELPVSPFAPQFPSGPLTPVVPSPPLTPVIPSPSSTPVVVAPRPLAPTFPAVTSAYTALATLFYPWALPYDRHHERVRAFAEHLGLDFAELFRLFGRPDADIARAELGLPSGEWDILVAAGDTFNVERAWSLGIVDLATPSRFVRQAGLEPDALRPLTETWFLSADGAGDVTLVLTENGDPCDFDAYRVAGLGGPTLDQIQRFLRLQRRLAWSTETLDGLLQALNRRAIDGAALAELARAQRLAKSFGQDATTLAGLRGPDLPRWLGVTEQEAALFAHFSDHRGYADLELRACLGLLERWVDFRATGADLRELAYVLLGQDQVPAAFAPRPADVLEFLHGLRKLVLAERAAGTLLADPGPEPDPAARRAEDPAKLGKLIRENVAAWLALDPKGLAALPPLGDIQRFAAGRRATPDIARGAVTSLGRWHRLARLVGGLKLSAMAIKAARATRVENGFLDFAALLASDSADEATAASRFDGWLALARAARLSERLPRDETDLFAWISDAANTRKTDQAFLAALYAATGWNMDPATGSSFTNTAGRPLDVPLRLAEGMGLASGSSPEARRAALRQAFRVADTYSRIDTAVSWVRRWRVAPDELLFWSDPDFPTDRLAHSLETAAHARCPDDADWYRVLTPVNDRLRERQRETLLAAIIAHGVPVGASAPLRFQDAAEVYARYLIDPEMSACMLTTRIVQANAAVQLFVQRILQNLEDEVSPREDYAEDWHRHWARWPVMKNYRVWEANRKVFFYPENWLFPELRDDKSPFFVELENALLQDELTEATVNRAYREYLARLHEVARLDMRGFYIEETHNPRDELTKQVMHLFARTHSEPHFYFYRRRDLLTNIWSAWEKVDLNIEGEHLIPVVHNGQLMLFWSLFREKGGGSGETGFSQYDLSLAYSRYRKGRWSTPQAGSVRHSIRATDREGICFRLDDDAKGVRIHVYFSWADRLLGNYVISGSLFRLDACSDAMVVEPSEKRHLLLLPRNTRVDAMSFKETDEADSPFWLLRIIPADVSIDIAPETFHNLLRLMREGGLGGALVGAIVLAGLVSEEVLSILHGVDSLPLLNRTPGSLCVLPGAQFRQFDGHQPFFLQNDRHCMLVSPVPFTWDLPWSFGWSKSRDASRSNVRRWYRFELAYHPFICRIVERFQTQGFDGLLRPAPVNRPRPGIWFDELDRQFTRPNAPLTEYEPNRDLVLTPHPVEAIDFAQQSAYGLYNFELFFHIPLLVATRLSQAQRFEEAQRWFHYIFDPTDTSVHESPARYWRVKPFFELALAPPETLSQLLERIATRNVEALQQVKAWRNDPFNPHAIARLRHIAYMKAVVMGYLDNLIAWADELFRQDTRETVNEAAQFYLLAQGLLGPKPVYTPPVERHDYSYADFTGNGTAADELGNLWLELESLLPVDPGTPSTDARTRPPRLLPYFCLPSNDKLLAYWDTVADRLFKIRHCLDIEGRLRELPLFDPPIDPALLVRARAAGIDLRSALRGRTERPLYRFAVMYQKALEFCGEVRVLGSALLSALEKRDAEALSLLRSTHEQAMLQDISRIRDRQVDEARENLESLNKSRLTAEARQEFYSSREFMNAAEITAMALQGAAHVAETVGQGYTIAASAVHLIPQIHVQGPSSGSSTGGQQVGDSLSAAAATARFIASQLSFAAGLSSTIGGYQRRQDDWNLQAELARREIAQIDKQKAAAEIRLAMAENERDNHQKQRDRAAEVDGYLRGKFTNQQLYNWMSGQLAGLHYQAYQLAREMAMKAEVAARFELGSPPDEPKIIGNRHSDPTYRYLTAGEALAHDLRRLELNYLERNARRLEITSHFSLRRLDGEALWNLRISGICSFALPTTVLDLDFPGLTQRRIKSVSVSIPCVVGPYVGVHGILRLASATEHRVIATSSGQGDAGLFQLDFRDERYLPFEGVSLEDISLDGARRGTPWEFTLPQTNPPFDYGTISDLLLHIQYTAVEAAGDARAPRARSPGTFQQLISVKHDFPAESRRLLSDSAAEITVSLDDRLFPYFARKRSNVAVKWLRPGGAAEAMALADPPHLTLAAADAEGYLVVEYTVS